MTISELARRAGVAPSAIRWYEAAGILPPPRRTANRYRAYGDDDVTRLRLLVVLRHVGLGPTEAARLADACLRGVATDPAVLALIADQRAAIGSHRAELDRLEAELIDLQETFSAAGRSAGRERPMPTDPIRVLFVCTGNSARSQIAEALLGTIGGPDFLAASAGTEPAGVNPWTIRVLGERGIDWSRAESKTVARYLGQPWDYVITVCDRARQSCPVFPGDYNRLHWGLDDPAAVDGTDAERLAAFERTATELTLRLRPFVEIALRSAGRSPGSEA
ncbi:MAG: MerR family transcriptional regulator [Chloroflexota bacterium]